VEKISRSGGYIEKRLRLKKKKKIRDLLVGFPEAEKEGNEIRGTSMP